VGIALGALVRRWPLAARVAVLALLVLASARARASSEFSTGGGPWSNLSHLDRAYVERGMETSARFIRELRAARPHLPPRSTVFFADVPPSVGFQTANGPVIRWAYRDSSLRSYYLTELTGERLARGSAFFFAVENQSLRDRTDDPDLLARAAYSMIVSERPRAAAPILEAILARTPEDAVHRYRLAWCQWSLGDTAGAGETLTRCGIAPRVASAPSLDSTMSQASSPDTAKAIAALLAARSRAGLTPQIHARLAALWLVRKETRPLGVIEAYAVTVLAPSDADAWRMWAGAQLAERQYDLAARSLRRYFAVGGARAAGDPGARQILTSLDRLLGGRAAGGTTSGPSSMR
jgi:hypothetical protein